jgi:hypothetical protein
MCPKKLNLVVLCLGLPTIKNVNLHPKIPLLVIPFSQIRKKYSINLSLNRSHITHNIIFLIFVHEKNNYICSSIKWNTDQITLSLSLSLFVTSGVQRDNTVISLLESPAVITIALCSYLPKKVKVYINTQVTQVQ